MVKNSFICNCFALFSVLKDKNDLRPVPSGSPTKPDYFENKCFCILLHHFCVDVVRCNVSPVNVNHVGCLVTIPSPTIGSLTGNHSFGQY